MSKYRSRIVLLFSLLVLGACNTPSSSEQPSNSTPASSSGTPSISSENPSVSSENISEGGSSYNLEVEYTSPLWPSAAIDYVLEGLGVTVPSYTSDNPFVYMLIEDEDGLYIAISTEVADISSEDAYNDILGNAGWMVDDTYYDEYGFFAMDATGKVEMQYFWFEGEFVWYIYPALNSETPSEPEEPGSSEELPTDLESAVWPAEAIAAYLGNEITVTVPSLSSENPYFYGVKEEEGLEYFLVYTEMIAVEAASGFFDVEETYSALLLDAGWIIDDSGYDEYGFFAVDATETVVVQYYWWDGLFAWFVMPNEEEVANPGEVAVDGVATFDLSNENALVTKDPNSSVWVVAPASMTISKGTATVNVGNGTFFSGPLRVYQNQIVVFTVESGYQIDSIVITVNDLDAKYLTVLTSSAFTNATTSISGQKVTLTPTDKTLPVQIIASNQTRFDSVVITLSAI